MGRCSLSTEGVLQVLLQCKLAKGAQLTQRFSHDVALHRHASQLQGVMAAARRAQVMMKLKNSRNLDARQSLLLESAFYAARPPERTAARRKQRPPLREYMRHLVHERLTHAELKQARLMMRNQAFGRHATMRLTFK